MKERWKQFWLSLLAIMIAMTGSVYADDIEATLDSADGSSAFEVLDSSSAVVSQTDSDGNLYVVGNVGIGTTTTADYELEVSGSLKAGTVGSTNNSMFYDNNTDTLTLYENFASRSITFSPAANSSITGGTAGFFSINGGSGTNLALNAGTGGGGDARFTLESDGDSHLYIDANNSFDIRNDSSTVINRFEEQGNVGIGTETPLANLHIGTGDPDEAISTEDVYIASDLEVDGSIYLADGTELNDVSDLGGTSGWTDGGTDVYVSDSTDNVGLGTIDPTATLEIVEQSEHPFMVSSDATGDGDFMIVQSDGNVGIGTPAPSAGFNLHEGIFELSLTSINPFIQIRTDAGFASFYGYSTMILGTQTGSSLLFETNDIERMRIHAAGNVAIGTTSPVAELHIGDGDPEADLAGDDVYIASDLEVDGSIYLADGTELNDASDLGTASGFTDGGTDIYVTTSTDNVGLGTIDPTATLEIIEQGEEIFMISSDATGNGDLMIIQSDGNVGIGSTATSSKLFVEGGDIRIINDGGDPQMLVGDNIGGQWGAVEWDSSDDRVDITHSGNEIAQFYTSSGHPIIQGQWIYAIRSTDDAQYVLGDGVGAGQWGVLEWDMATDTMRMGTQSAGLATIVMTEDNNVGIATIDPSATMEIVQNSTADPFMISSDATADGDYLVVLSDGNMGIGVVDPNSLLGVGANGDVLVTDGSDTVSTGGLNVNIANDGSNYAAGFQNAHANGNGVIIRAGLGGDDVGLMVQNFDSSITAMTVRTGGEVGIGENSPEAHLEVTALGSTGDYVFKLSSDTTTIADGDILVVEEGGNVGIGSTNPLVDLHIGMGDPDADLSDEDVYIASDLEVDGSIYLADGTELNDASDLGGATGWTDGGTDVYLTTGTDNVGIGSSIPEEALEVQAANNEDAVLLLDADNGDDDTDAWRIRALASSNALELVNASAEARFILAGGGGLRLPGVSAGLTLYENTDATALDFDIRTTSLPTSSYVYTAAGSGSFPFDTWGNLIMGPAASADVVIGRNNQMVVNDGGNIGIGTWTPSGLVEIVESGSHPFMISSDATGDGDFLIVQSDGNVGIGTVEPSAPFNIKIPAHSDTDEIISVGADNSSSTFNLGISGGGNIRTWINTSGDKLTIDEGSPTAASVGIGTSDPQAGLHVVRDSLGISLLVDSDIDANDTALQVRNNNPATSAADDDTTLIVTGPGNVGVGTYLPLAHFVVGDGDPDEDLSTNDAYIASDLEVDGSIYLADGTEINDASDLGGASGWTDGGADVYLTTGTDNVGIGTTSPLAAMDVRSDEGIILGANRAMDITVSSDTTTFRSNIADEDIIFELNDGGTMQSLMTLDASSPSVNIEVTDGSGRGLHVDTSTGTEFIQLSPSNAEHVGIQMATNNGLRAVGFNLFNNGDGTTWTFGSALDENFYFNFDGRYDNGTLGNSAEFVIDSTEGNVGIGTTETSPDGMFEITLASNRDSPFMISSDPTADGDLVIVQSDGNVGLGTPTPNWEFTLTDGQIGVGTTASASNLSIWPNITSGNPYFYIYGWDGGASAAKFGRLQVDTGGGFTISADTGEQLSLVGANVRLNPAGGVTYTDDAFRMQDDTSAVYGTDGDYGIGYSSTDDSLQIFNGNTVDSSVRVAMDSNGNIGIGTSIANALLHVEDESDLNLILRSDTDGGAKNENYINFDNRSQHWAIGSKFETGYPSFRISASSTVGTSDILTLRDTGNVGVGTSVPLAMFVVGDGDPDESAITGTDDAYIAGDLEVDGVLYGDGSGLSNISAGGWTDGGADVYLTTSTDNVGIGTSIPLASLDIVGAGATSATSSLRILDSSQSELFELYDSGQVTFNGASIQDNDNDIGFGILLDSSHETGLFVTDLFNLDSNDAVISAALNTSNFERIFYGNQAANTNVTNDQTGLGFVYHSQTEPGNDTAGAGGFYSRVVHLGNTVLTGDLYNYVAHTYVQGSGGTATVTNAYGFRSKPQLATATSDITNMYDFFTTPVIGSSNGTISNRYGLFLDHDDDGVTNAWGVYQEQSAVNNYFSGNVGIGSSSFAGSAKLEIASIDVTPFMISSDPTADGDIMIVQSDGNVGIGTTAPVAALHFNAGYGAMANGITFSDGDTGIYELIDDQLVLTSGDSARYILTGGAFRGSSTRGASLWYANNAGAVAYGFTDDIDTGMRSPIAETITLQTDGTERFRVDANGNVGIGTVNTVVGAKLEIDAEGGTPFMISSENSQDGDLMIVTSVGNVGIGTTVNDEKLHITDDNPMIKLSNTAESEGGLIIQDADTPAQYARILYDAGGQNDLSFYNASATPNLVLDGGGRSAFGLTTPESGRVDIRLKSGEDYLSVSNSTRGDVMIVTNAENVGIGTSVPLAMFVVGDGDPDESAITGTDDAYIAGDLEVDGVLYGDGSGLSNISAGGWTDGGANVYTTVSTDNVGIGSIVASAMLEIVQDSSDHLFMISSDATGDGDYIFVQSDGNVGIGDITPEAKVKVQGNHYISGELRFASFQNTAGTLSSGASGALVVNNATGASVNDLRVTSDSGAGYSATSIDMNGAGTGLSVGQAGSGKIVSIFDGTVAAGTEIFSIIDGGNVGINTDDPSAQLELVNNDTFPFMISSDATGDGDYLIVQSDGNVGIGTTAPLAELHIGDGDPEADLAGDDVYVASDLEVDGSIYLADGTELNDVSDLGGGGWTDGGADVYLTTIGDNVGIGTAVPMEKLHVEGNIRMTGSLNDSDRRLKTDIEPFDQTLDLVTQIEGVTYRWKDLNKDQTKQIGVIAQDVEKVFPDAVKTYPDGIKAVNYPVLVVPLYEAVKEMKTITDDLREENEALRNRIDELERTIGDLGMNK